MEAHAEKIEDLALHPVRPWPYRNDRIDDGIVPGQANAQANFVAARDARQVVIQLEARLEREPVHANNVGEEVEVKGCVLPAAVGSAANQLARHSDRDFSAKFADALDRARIPLAQPLSYKISVGIRLHRHVSFPG